MLRPRLGDPLKKTSASFLPKINNVRAERNVYVHGLWAKADPPSLAIATTAKWDRREVVRNEVVGIDDLHGLLEEIEDIFRQLLSTGHILGFHPGPPTPQRLNGFVAFARPKMMRDTAESKL